MVVTEIDARPLTLTDDPDRPKGLHLSQIINSMMVGLDPGRYNKRDQSEVERVAGVQKMATGVAFETLMERTIIKALHPQVFRPAAICCDGVWMSPDAVDPEEWCPHEYKLTWYSTSKECPTDPVYWPWIIQIRCYARALDADHGYLTAYHINGNYKPPRPIPPRTWRLDFTKEELDGTWYAVLQHAREKRWLPPDLEWMVT